MSGYPLEVRRSRGEELERCVRLATLALREQELIPLRSAKKKAPASLGGEVGGAQDADARSAQSVFVDVNGDPRINNQRDSEGFSRFFIDRAHELAREIVDSYADRDGQLSRELKTVGGEGNIDAALRVFRQRMALLQGGGVSSARDAMMDAAPTSAYIDRETAFRSQPETDFTGEEAMGKYLDLNEHHLRFVNLKGIDAEQYDYLTYVSTFFAFSTTPNDARKRPAYSAYLQKLLDYLIGFCDRVTPLWLAREKAEDVREKTLKEMESGGNEIIDCSKYDGAQALADGESAEKLKEALGAMGLKVGGTPLQRAQRLFDAVSKTNGAVENGQRDGSAKHGDKPDQHRETRLLEAQIKFLCEETLAEYIENTKMNIEKKRGLSYDELEAERINEEAEGRAEEEAQSESSDEERPIYNPKDVPLGWDGKPIPYWLYKLHGLNHEFKCEICGDITYRGPRAFERHFTDTRHTHNLRMLGIQYSRYYFMITKIQDALQLHAKHQKESTQRSFRPENDEEYEDADGNVFNRKTYEDLLRQGLL